MLLFILFFCPPPTDTGNQPPPPPQTHTHTDPSAPPNHTTPLIHSLPHSLALAPSPSASLSRSPSYPFFCLQFFSSSFISHTPAGCCVTRAMATAMWRMNGPQEKMSGVALLLLGALLLNNGMMCQGDKTDAENGTDVSVTPTQVVTRAANTQGIRASGGLTDAPTPANIPTKNSNVADRADRVTNPPVMTTPVAPETKAPETKAPFQLVVPVVICEEKVINEVRVKAAVSTSTCEETKAILEEAPITRCAAKVCHLQVSQDGNEILVASPDVTSSNIEAALLSEGIKKRLGVSAVEHSSTSSGVSVLVGVLVTGLLLAAGLIGGYCFKNRRTAGDKGSRLAEVGLGYPVDGENQGNTLVSVASLIPPPEIQEPTETTKIPETAEIQEKPSVNGETPEEVTTDPTAFTSPSCHPPLPLCNPTPFLQSENKANKNCD